MSSPKQDSDNPEPEVPAAAPFDQDAASYDAWYDTPEGRALLQTELQCVRPLLERFPRPYLEIGVGTGRFAEALGVEHGVEPAREPLAIARKRGIQTALGTAEDLPYPDSSFGAALMVFTWCFLQDKDRALAEIHRVMSPDGGLVLGFLPAEGAWAKSYASQGAAGHPIYRHASFDRKDDVELRLKRAGFRVADRYSALFQAPDEGTNRFEQPVRGHDPAASFVAMACVRAQQESSDIKNASGGTE